MPDALKRPEPLTPQHDVDGFDCGHESLNTYLKRFAWQSIAPNKDAAWAKSFSRMPYSELCKPPTLLACERSWFMRTMSKLSRFTRNSISSAHRSTNFS